MPFARKLKSIDLLFYLWDHLQRLLVADVIHLLDLGEIKTAVLVDCFRLDDDVAILQFRFNGIDGCEIEGPGCYSCNCIDFIESKNFSGYQIDRDDIRRQIPNR